MALAPAAAIDALLPQTQCTRCGYQGCLPYATAISTGEAPINQCPPGGSATIARLAQLLNRPALPLNPEHGFEQARQVASIIEVDCIGCTKCLAVCPVDAIVGAAQRMHSVISSECTGCELCVAPCPVDCIVMVADSGGPAGESRLTMSAAESIAARARFAAHLARTSRRASEQAEQLAARRLALRGNDGAALSEALARAKAKRTVR